VVGGWFNRLCEIYEELDLLDGEDAGVKSRRAAGILAGLGFKAEQLEEPISTLSGGWRMRVALASALFMSPHLLLLDEPTNHLDVKGILWLQRYLCEEFRGTLLCVSHDRSFVDNVATEIMIMHDAQLDYFTGNLTEFDEQAAEKGAGLEKQVAALDKKRAHIESSVLKMKQAAGGKSGDQKKSAQAASRQKKLGRMGLEKAADGTKHNSQKHGIRRGALNENDGGWKNGKMSAAPLLQRDDPSLQFHFPEAAPLGVSKECTVLEFKNVSFCYPGAAEPVLQGIDLAFTAKCRVAVVGRNGAGKSTFVKLLTQTLNPSHGEVTRHHNLKVALYSQHHTEELEASGAATPLAYMQECFPELKEQELRSLLGSFGLKGDLALQEMATLSGGQKVRVTFAKMAKEAPHMLVLDEPTNHLDIYSIEALVESLKRFQGGVVIISHNQSLLTALTSEAFLASKKYRNVAPFAGTVSDYIKKQQPGSKEEVLVAPRFRD